MSTSDKEMGFWDHLSDLRAVMIRIIVVVVVLAIGFFIEMPWIFNNVITAPCDASFPTYHLLDFIKGDGMMMPDMGGDDFRVSLINIELASQFFVHMSASMWLAFIVAFPIIIYLLWTFVAPGLYEREKRGARRAFIWGNLLFYLGMAVGYFIVFPLALRFLADYQLSDKIANTVSLTSYIDTFFMFVLMMGLLFELPVLAWMLGRIGILKRGFFGKYRKYAIVSILVLAGIITPTSDLFTLFVVFLPVYLLWECSAMLVPKSQPQ